MSPAPDSALADPQQIIADLQRELAERTAERDEASRRLDQRTAERDEASAREAAAAEVLGVINSSPGNLAPVFDAMLERAVRLCELDFALLWTYDGSAFHPVARHRVPDPFWAFLQENTPPVFARLVGGERLVHIADIHDGAITETDFGREVIRLGFETLHSILIVPLRKGEVLLGVINSYRHEVRPFTDKQVALLENFATQAVIAMENARLITETREALDQQTATAEVLQVINSSPGDLTPVFEALLDKATRLCDAAFGILWIYDGGRFHPVARHRVPGPFAEFLRTYQPEPGATTTGLGAMLRGEAFEHLIDAADTELYRSSRSAPDRAFVDLGGARTGLIVALRKDRTLLGAIRLYRQEVRPFTDKQIALLQNFAAQAVIAMENARLITETREALDQQTATAEVLGVINASPGDLAPVFDAILEKAHALCGVASGSLQLYDGQLFRAVAAHGMPEPLADLLRQPYAPEPGSASDHLLAGDAFYQIADLAQAVTQASAANSRIRLSVELNGVRTLLFVPLRKDDALLGLITAARQEVRPFSDKQIALLQNFAAQAVIAMENARLITETREALEQQTATAEVLGVINSSPGDLAPVFDAMLEKAMRLCDVAFGFLTIYDGNRFRAAALRGVPSELAAYFELGMDQPRPGEAHARLLAGEDLIHSIDQMDEEPYRQGRPLRRAVVDLGGARTALIVALRKDSTLLGVFTVYRKEVRPFTDKQIALLQNFAAQAVIAMENARLITETREALEQQTATAEVLQVINSSPGDLAPVFDAILEKAHSLCGASKGALVTYDGERFQGVAMRGLSEPYATMVREQRVNPPGSPPLRLLGGERFVEILDCRDMELPIPRAAFELEGVRTVSFIPLRRDEALLGYITAYRQEVRAFSEREIALLQNFAAQAVIAMENARLLDEIRQRQAELRVTFDNMADGVIMFDEDLRLAAWNRNFQELLDLPDAVLAERPSYADYLRILAERGEFGTGDIEAELNRRLENMDQEFRQERTRPDGRVIEVRRNSVPDGGFVLIYSDITERKRSEAEIRAARDAAEATLRDLRAAQANLIQAEKMASLGQLTAGIAHEIKNPLNFVNNFADLSGELLKELQESAAPGWAALDDDKRAEIDETMVMLTGNLEKIGEHGRRADGIVKSMLEHSRGVTSERRVVDLNNLIEEALNLAYHGARAQDQTFNIRMDRDFDRDLARIELVPQEMSRVFINLFGNGFYAATKRQRDSAETEFHPTLTVATRDLGGAVEVKVRDNGTGIPAEIRDKLFQPFFTTKPTGEGTGLGLSISYDIVTQQHGGTIEVESEPGAFTEFTIRLPRASQSASTGAAS